MMQLSEAQNADSRSRMHLIRSTHGLQKQAGLYFSNVVLNLIGSALGPNLKMSDYVAAISQFQAKLIPEIEARRERTRMRVEHRFHWGVIKEQFLAELNARKMT